MPNYQNGKIYMIESLEGNCIYYGSTVNTLSRRLTDHRSKIKQGVNISSKEVLKYPDARILLITLFPCNSKMELEAKEATYIRNNDCINKCIPQRKQKEWYQDNKDAIAKQQKQYQQDNKEPIKQYQKQYLQDNKEAITKQKKQYQQDNKDAIAKNNKQYRANNKIAIKEFKSKKCLCNCGKTYQHSNYKRHTQSKNHQFYQKTYNFIIS